MYTNLKHLEEELLLSIKTNNSRNVRTKRLNSSSDEPRKCLASDATLKRNSSKKALFPAGKESKSQEAHGSLVVHAVGAVPVYVTNASSLKAEDAPQSSNYETCARNRSSEAPAASVEASQSPVVQVCYFLAGSKIILFAIVTIFLSSIFYTRNYCQSIILYRLPLITQDVRKLSRQC